MNPFTKVRNTALKIGTLFLRKTKIPLVYNQNIAPTLPRTAANYNGVLVYGARLFDSIIPWRTRDEPYYESAMVASLKKSVLKGDEIVIVGGGWGVTAVKAAQKAGSSGEITVYEGSINQIRMIKETLGMNNIPSKVTLIHSIVGPAVELHGDASDASPISPEELPKCDVLELDCEGSELQILKDMQIQPRVILVESHGMNGAPSSEIEEILEKRDYSIKNKNVAEERMRDFSIDNDIFVLTAEKK